MTSYKYFLLFFVFFICCEKSNYLTNTGQYNLSLCNDTELITERISVLSFNRLNGTSIHSVSQVIDLLQPDIIGLQESYDAGIELADRFNYCFYGDNTSSVAILSKYPFEVINDSQFKIIMNDDLFINFFNIHLPAYPYQPYDIRDTLITTELQAIHQAEQTRGTQVNELINLVDNINNQMPIVIVGDFNEPSHLDWVIGAANPMQFQFNNQLLPFTVDWPTSKKMLDAGFSDAYRVLFNNPIDYPGYTWTTNYSINEVHDRIDFIYYNEGLILDSLFLGGPDDVSSIIVPGYESDHRALFSIFTLPF